ncbi:MULTISPECIES: hypothetical protein [Haloferax]|nr:MULTISPECIES: hypothetical protein [Haloferax]
MLLVAMILASTLTPFVGVVTAAPSGLVGVPDANVSEDFPVGTSQPLRAADLEGSVMASDHAESLEVIATTPDRASEYVNGTTVGGGEVVLVLRDDVHSTGRTVAIDAGAVRDALGYTPERIYGTHDDGSEWSSPVRYDAGLLLFDVAHFSSNVVSFSGTVEVSASGALDGTNLDYSLASTDSVSNLSVNVTGHTRREWDNESTAGVVDGESISLSIGGNVTPSGPSSNDKPIARVTSIGDDSNTTYWEGPKTGDGRIAYVSSGSTYYGGEVSFDAGYVDTVTGISFPATTDPSGLVIDVYINNEAPDGQYGETGATLVKSGWKPSGEGMKTISFSAVDVDPSKPVTFEFDVVGGSDTDELAVPENSSETGGSAFYGGEKPPREAYIHGHALKFDASVTGPNGTTTMTGSGGVATGEVALTTSTSSVSFSTPDTGVDYQVEMLFQERQTTTNPSVTINGHTTSYTGSLSEGESVQLPANDSWLTTGENNITVGTGLPPNADDPSPVVDVSISHTAQDDQSVNFSGGKWIESYNFSRAYSQDTNGATLTISFGSNVASLKNLETRTNSGSWSTVAPGDYTLDGSTLTVKLGSVSGGNTVTVRTTGQRVVAVNGTLTVTDPTPLGERLDSGIRLESWANDSYISLGGSPDEGRLHYTYNESFGDSEYDEVTATGYHRLHLPSASSTSTFRVSTIPVGVDVATGEARFRVTEPSTTEPKISVMPGEHPGDGVSFEFLAPSGGQKYILYSTTEGTQRDSTIAGETVSLQDDDSDEILHIRLSESTTDTSDGPGFWGDGGSVTDVANDYVPAMPVLNPGLVAAIVLVIIAGAIGYTERRSSSSGTSSTPVYSRPLVLLSLVVAAFIGILLISPESITGPVKSALDTALPLASVLGVMLAVGAIGYWWYTRREARVAEAKAPENVFQIGGDDD